MASLNCWDDHDIKLFSISFVQHVPESLDTWHTESETSEIKKGILHLGHIIVTLVN